MTTKLTPEQIEEVANDLRGTTQDLDGVLKDHGLPSSDEIEVDSLSEIDDKVFLCESCNWWCDTSEMSDHGYFCTDCDDFDEDEDDEDEDDE